MADELIDIFDENMNLLGTALKSQAHREGLWHKTFHCWLARKNDEGRVMVWLQLRNKDKSIYPDMLDVSAAGHVKSGEEVKDGYREVTEELGLSCRRTIWSKCLPPARFIRRGKSITGNLKFCIWRW